MRPAGLTDVRARFTNRRIGRQRTSGVDRTSDLKKLPGFLGEEDQDGRRIIVRCHRGIRSQLDRFLAPLGLSWGPERLLFAAVLDLSVPK